MKNITELIKNSGPAKLAAKTSRANILPHDSGVKKTVLVELNHLWPHHCALPVILNSLRSSGEYQFKPFIAIERWDAKNETLRAASAFYEAMGIDSHVIKPDHGSYIAKAKSIVISEFHFFQGSIWNLTDFKYEELPLGVYLVEIILGERSVAYCQQSLETIKIAINSLAKYLWWRNYLAENQIQAVLGTHLCYEFALPHLAAFKNGVVSYTFSETTFNRSYNYLPLPILANSWTLDIQKQWEEMPVGKREEYLARADRELQARVTGKRVGSLQKDPRFLKNIETKMKPINFKSNGLPNVVVYVHAFSDAPCCLPKSEFGYLCSPYTATEKVINTLSALPINLYVKSHPDPFPHDASALSVLIDRHDSVVRLENDLTPEDMKNSNVDLIVTGWGSICYEAAYCEIPVVAYSNLYPVKQLGEVPVIDLNNENKIKEVCMSLLLNKRTEYNKKKIIETYAKFNMAVLTDLTCSDLGRLDAHEGETKRYSINAYQYWMETFDRDSFELTCNALVKYLHSSETVFTAFNKETI
jgi:hypothetical protein